MRNALLLAVLGYSSFLVSCSDGPSAAGTYLSKKSGADATPEAVDATPAPATPTVNSAPAPTATAGDIPAQTGTPAMPPPTTAAGDSAKGLAIIKSTCSLCHVTGGLGKVALNKTFIPRLDQAYTGEQKAMHMSYKDAFTGSGRIDLEAALKTLN